MDLRDRDDDGLVTLALSGDADAYGVLVERYRGAVHGVVYAIVGPVPEVEDLAQETFLRAYLHLGQLREAALFAPWLRRVGVSVCLNWVEAHRPDRLRGMKDIVDLEARDLIDPQKGPEEQLADKELGAAALDALAALPARYRLPVVMLYLDGESHEAAAKLLRKPVGTIKSLVHRGREMLREALEKTVDDSFALLERRLEAQRLSKEFAVTTTRILKAAQEGNLDEVRELVAKNRKLANAQGEHDKTPLHWAAQRNDEALAALLVASGANVEERTAWGATALEWAANMGSAEVAELLLARGAQGMNLWVAAALGKRSLVEEFLEKGAPAPRPARRGEAAAFWPEISALMRGDAISDAFYIACRNGHTLVAELLLDRGACVDARGYFAGTALHWAAHHGHADTVEMLARRGADLSIRDERFAATAAGWAIEGGHRAIATRLVDLGARVTIWEAANYENLEAVRRMLDADPALLDARGEWGTALHEAAFFGHGAIVALLLERGADVSLRTCRDETALGLARRRGHTQIASLLEASSEMGR